MGGKWMKVNLKLQERKMKIPENKRNYVNIISCNNSSIINTSKCNNKYGIQR